MERTSARRGLAALIAVTGALAAGAANAHPHMWIDARAVVDLDEQHRITAVRQVWLFDEMFGAYATQGLKKGKGGTLADDTLKGMAQDWMKALGEPVSHYFTRVTVAGKTIAFAAPRDARVTWNPKTGRLALAFTLPLAEPAALDAAGAQVDIYDPTYFVAYAFDEKGAVTLGGPGAAACKPAYRKPKELDWNTMQQLAAIPADPDALPEELFAITKGLTHRIEVQCA
ncbi:hypothetical protein LMG3458_01455 [Achromobacter deleyi]|uniref:DUF1007 family protein n=1 Tax=Achromobacter deleyi TaxID=1353891 RepID=A0A6S6ZFR2_9BURK|nr:DUF1007 family protein [Achromobacter deleyi]CAB3678090.1 hypothetical protein LMG3458_01455 [Achromobacter deleyi]CAB3834492.1 hypothetical protein LMG3481_00928 [Achromobacter deleyi]CAB3865583.1 hypothetical protein LMG3482_02506 [Achromobacter deleyi]